MKNYDISLIEIPNMLITNVWCPVYIVNGICATMKINNKHLQCLIEKAMCLCSTLYNIWRF